MNKERILNYARQLVLEHRRALNESGYLSRSQKVLTGRSTNATYTFAVDAENTQLNEWTSQYVKPDGSLTGGIDDHDFKQAFNSGNLTEVNALLDKILKRYGKSSNIIISKHSKGTWGSGSRFTKRNATAGIWSKDGYWIVQPKELSSSMHEDDDEFDED